MAARYLYNTIDSACGQQSPAYVVDDSPVRLTVIGLLPGQTVPLLLRISGSCTAPGGKPCRASYTHAAPMYRGGCLAALSSEQTTYIEAIPGSYEIDTSALPPGQAVAIHFEELTGMSERSAFNFTQSMASCPAASCPSSAPLGVVSSWG